MSARSVSIPTTSDDVRLLARTVRLVVATPVYALLTVVASLIGLSVFVLGQNVALVETVIVGGTLPLENRLEILINLYPYVGTAFDPLLEAILVLSAALFGLNVALLTYHLLHDGVSLRSGGGSVTGMILGTIGAGCAACGTILFAGILSLFGATWMLALFPLEGMEFAILSLFAMGLSLYWLADGMRGLEVEGCPIDR